MAKNCKKQKYVMHMQSCSFAYLTYCLFAIPLYPSPSLLLDKLSITAPRGPPRDVWTEHNLIAYDNRLVISCKFSWYEELFLPVLWVFKLFITL